MVDLLSRFDEVENPKVKAENFKKAHHIEYFTRSMNNNASNIIIVNPNFHRIIHQASPIFDRKTLSFRFPNGVIEKVKLDKHLNCK